MDTSITPQNTPPPKGKLPLALEILTDALIAAFVFSLLSAFKVDNPAVWIAPVAYFIASVAFAILSRSRVKRRFPPA